MNTNFAIYHVGNSITAADLCRAITIFRYRHGETALQELLADAAGVQVQQPSAIERAGARWVFPPRRRVTRHSLYRARWVAAVERKHAEIVSLRGDTIKKPSKRGFKWH